MIILQKVGDLFRWNAEFTRRNRAAGTILNLLVVIGCLAGFIYMAELMINHRPCGPSCHG